MKSNYLEEVRNYQKIFIKEFAVIYSEYKKDGFISKHRRNISQTKYNKSIADNIKYNRLSKIYTNFVEKKKKYLLAIHSHASLFYQRYVFRKIIELYDDFQLLFFVSKIRNLSVNHRLYNEIQFNKDIILFNFYGNYYNLHYMTYNFLNWIVKYKHLYKVIIKQDTDTFLNINLLKCMIDKFFSTNTSFVIGKMWYKNDKNKEYPSGMSYIFSSHSLNYISSFLHEEYIELKSGYPEDMYFGRLVRKAGIPFYDIQMCFKMSIYLALPKYAVNIRNILMIHSLRVSEIAFFHFIINITKMKNSIKNIKNE